MNEIEKKYIDYQQNKIKNHTNEQYKLISRGEFFGGWRFISAAQCVCGTDRTATSQDREILARAKNEGWLLNSEKYISERLFASGGEAEVFYFDRKTDTLEKVFSYKAMEHEHDMPEKFLIRMALFNVTFPETRLTLKGIAEMNNTHGNNLKFIFEQEFVAGKMVSEIINELSEIEQQKLKNAFDVFMFQKGFSKDDNGVFFNEIFKVYDLHGGNVFVEINELEIPKYKFSVIDAITALK
ncbi:MAG: hypothetical protein LBN95_10050 [Prevotellaceae bacterium]|jgi:hypothetical protein|nr:hypothetical protein [Prevotellaceae bacterium]